MLSCSVAMSTLCAGAAGAAAAPHPAKPFNINDVRLIELTEAIECLPHEPETTSTSTPQNAIKDGDAVLSEGHCQQAIADYQVAIDANQADTSALWHQELAALREMGLTGDVTIATHVGEMAYHDCDLAVAAQPKDAIFLMLRAYTRLALIPIHAMHRSAFSIKHYVAGEDQHSYDDLTTAIAIAPNYGDAYAIRWLIDMQRNDQEQANYDIAQAQKYDPEAAKFVENLHQEGVERQEQIAAAEERKRMAMAEFWMGMAVASGAVTIVPGP